MKLQVFILAIGVALSAGAVSAEMHRAASVTSIVQTGGSTIAVAQTPLQQPAVTPKSKISISGARPSVKGGSGDD